MQKIKIIKPFDPEAEADRVDREETRRLQSNQLDDYWMADYLRNKEKSYIKTDNS